LIRLVNHGATDSVEHQAAHWAVLSELGDMTPESRIELEAWLAADRSHRGAFLRARAGVYAMEDMVLASKPGHVSHEHSSHPSVPDNDNWDQYEAIAGGSFGRGLLRWSGRALAGGAALAASVAMLNLTGISVFSIFHKQQDAVGEILALQDGSVATLSSDARISVTFSPDSRRITLLSGKASFKVAHNKARPFVVQAGEVYAQATGTVYSVERIGHTGGRVQVDEGSVLVWPGEERDQAVLIHAGGKLTLEPGARPVESPAYTAPKLPAPALAQFSFDNVPVKQAAARFNSVNSAKIIIEDTVVGDMRIVGLFRANDPERFARAVAALSDHVVEYRQGKIVIKMK